MKKAMVNLGCFLVLTVLLVTTGTVQSAADSTSVQDHLTVWQAQNISTYAFDYQRICYCLPFYEIVRITVVEGQIVAVHDAQSGAPIEPEHWWRYHTIDALFSILLNAETGGAAQLVVTYHPTLGYPIESSIDYDANITDDEISYRVTGFTQRPIIPRLYLPAVFVSP